MDLFDPPPEPAQRPPDAEKMPSGRRRIAAPLHFDGETYSAAEDGERLATQLRRVYQAFRSGEWWTLARLAKYVGGSEAGVSARIRDLRKERFGGHLIDRRRIPDSRGLWEYRMVDNIARPDETPEES